MPITSLQLRQDARNPEKRWIYFSDPATGVPSQYTLTKEQFAQLQNAGLSAQEEFNNPLYYNKGQLESYDQILKEANRPLPGNLGADQQNIDEWNGFRDIIAKAKTAGTSGGYDLANDPQRQQYLQDYSMGGAKNILTPGVKDMMSQGKVSAQIMPQQSQALPFGLNESDLSNPAVQQSLKAAGYDEKGQKITTQQAGSDQIDGGQQKSPEQIAQSTKDFLKSIGVSDDLINSLAPNQLNTFAMMQQVMQKKAENDQKLAPKDLTLDEINRYLEDAKTELDPYYKEQFDFAKQDLLQNIAFQTGQLQDLEAMQATQFQQQQEQLGGQMAESGLAQSGIRQEAEKRLREQQQGIVKSQRRQLGQNIYGVGSELERTFGSEKAASLYPTLKSQAQVGLPEQGLSYTPLGGRMGSLGKEQEIANRQRQQELALEALQKRQLLANQ